MADSIPIPSEAALEHERLTSLINSMADGVIAVDEQGKIVLSNGAALNIVDVNDSMLGRWLDSVLKLVDRNNQPVEIRRLVLEAKTPITNRDLRLQYADGSKVSLYISIAPVRLGYGHGGGKGFVVLLRDITHEKSLEEERDEFISVVSHELRTPIAIAEGNVSNALLMADKTGDLTAIKGALKQTYDQIVFLSGMINDLSTLSRAEQGKLNVEIESINTHDLVQDLAKNYEPDATKKGLELKVAIDPALEMLHSSRLYVREILQNFITNAIKYTPEGSVTIAAKPQTGGVEFSIIDTGMGISKGDQERVFDKFFRSDDAKTQAIKGTGLGLYVTMKLARLIHAEIDVKSELGQGSTFSIFIPNLK